MAVVCVCVRARARGYTCEGDLRIAVELVEEEDEDALVVAPPPEVHQAVEKAIFSHRPKFLTTAVFCRLVVALRQECAGRMCARAQPREARSERSRARASAREVEGETPPEIAVGKEDARTPDEVLQVDGHAVHLRGLSG